MGLFKDKKELELVFDTFIREILIHPLIGPKLVRSKMIVQFQYTDPDTQITVNFKDASSDPSNSGPSVSDLSISKRIQWGETSLEPDVVFIQSADFSNRFWQGKENVIAALAKRQVTARGSITKALQLIPVIRPSFRIYPQVLEKLGLSQLVVK